MNLTPQQIQERNAHGPHPYGVRMSHDGTVSVGTEESLSESTPEYEWGMVSTVVPDGFQNRPEVMGDRWVSEILSCLPQSSESKSAFERGKLHLYQGRMAAAITELVGLTTTLDADWRSCYRAYCLLAWIYRDLASPVDAERYAALCREANPLFPQDLLDAGTSALRLADRRPVNADAVLSI